MDRERLKLLFLPRFGEYYTKFRQHAQEMDRLTIEQQLSSFTYRHSLPDMISRAGVGLAVVFGISKVVEHLIPETNLPHLLYLFSLGPQAYLVSGLSATRNIVIKREKTILQETLATS